MNDKVDRVEWLKQFQFREIDNAFRLLLQKVYDLEQEVKALKERNNG